ncbi:hypothetical protein EIP86_004039 [Pleurotus ostreatoroseus]|nr:hypothetical protein EIP86_004039 [Pleurotus ostreatoroseus]
MHTSGGRRIIGEAKEKSQAKSEHREALAQGKLTGLVENVADDVFTISLGSIPREETVTTFLTYVMVLLDDDSVERIRLQIPMWVGYRYGPTPEGMEDASAPSEQTCVRFHILVQTRGSIRLEDVSSPSHPHISVAPYQTQVKRPSRHRLSVKFRSTTFLKKDFVLRITAKGLDEPRCFVERDSKGTVAMQLTLLPKFQLPQIDAQEYLFLVDRSGSMEFDERLETAKRTLALLLRALPDRDTIFNVFQFDHTWHSLWQTSEVYNQNTLDHATHFVESLTTNGGTELGGALRRTLQTRNLDRPTVLFVLTDGEINSADQSIRIVDEAVARARPDAPLRVFTLGIGSTVSTATCLGIARAGNGECLMTTSAEGIFGKCSKLLGAGSGFLLKNVTVDWGVPPETIVPDGSPSVRFTATDQVIRQALSTVASIYPGFRLVVFAIIRSDQFVIPKEIKLRAQRDGTGDFLEFGIPVERVRFNDENVGHGLVHTLAARRLIMELEDSIIKQARPEDECVPLIVDLGKRYQLASRYTSFIATDGVKPEATLSGELKRTKSSHLDQGPQATWDLQNTALFALDVIATFLTTWFGPPPSAWRAESEMPGGDNPALSRPSSVLLGDGPGRGDEDDDDDDDSDATFTTLSSLEDYASSAWSASRPPTPPPDDPEFVRSPSPQFMSNREAGEEHVTDDVEDTVPIVPSDDVMNLARQMLYDGSFTPDAVTALEGDALQKGRQLGVDDRLWATVLAIAYFQKHLVGQRDLLDGLVKKALIYAYRHEGSGKSITWLLNCAASFV